jgi:PAP2 superfamily
LDDSAVRPARGGKYPRAQCVISLKRALLARSTVARMPILTIRHALRALPLSIAAVLASGGPALAQQAAVADAVGSVAMSRKDHDDAGEPADATLVVRWSQQAQDNAFALDPANNDPFPNARGWTMMYLAMHDALNAIVPRFRQYAFRGADASAHPIAAAAQAARDVMNHIYPTRQVENDAELSFWLQQIPDGKRKTHGIELGMASAAAIIKARANDKMLVVGEYTLQDPLEPGDYRFVPPLELVYRPAYGDSIPFAIGSGADFLPDPPPRLASRTYAKSVNETKDLGRLNSKVRTADQTHFGAWWLEFNEVQWNRIMRQLAEKRDLTLPDAVRMFALANMAIVDATVAVWHAKNAYDFWRPYHAIRLGDTDGNPLTEADPNWLSEHIVPPLQEYPSAHAIQCQAIARTLRSVFGTDRVSFATESTTALPSNRVRSFSRLSSASRECGESRIMAGYHYRFSVTAGARMGNRIAKRIVDTQLLRR